MTDTESLRLRSVTERFAESTEVLDQLRERLQGLVLAEDTQGMAARALDNSAERLTSLAGDVQAVVGELASAQVTVQEALQAARAALQNADVNRLIEQMEGMRSDIAGFNDVASKAQADAAALRAEVALLREELTAAKTEAAEAQRKLADIEAKLAHVPARARRKAGLT